MRARDVRAITFCVVTTPIVAVGAAFLLDNIVVALALTIAYVAWLLTRPRMVRVMRRLRGEEPRWNGYFDETGDRFKITPLPGKAPSPPHRTERP
jgi:hypothetical protein